MAKSKELKVETPIVEAKKNTESKKTEVKQAEVKNTDAKNTDAKKTEVAVKEAAPVEKDKEVAAAVKKTAAKSKKAVKEKSSVAPEVFIQYQEQQADVADVVARVKETYVSQKHRESSIKSLQIYIKPQDGENGKAYYVINDKIQGELDLF